MIKIESWRGSNVYGDPVYDQPVPYPALIQRDIKMIRNTKGQEVISTGQIYLDGTVSVALKDRITLPDGAQPPIQSISIEYDETGKEHHKVVYI